jgi:hypothetical protein
MAITMTQAAREDEFLKKRRRAAYFPEKEP